MDDPRISKEAIEAALIKWFGMGDWPDDSRTDMSRAISAADRARDRSYFEWRSIESCPKTSRARLVWCPEFRNIYLVSWSDIDGGWIIFGPGHDHLHEAPTYWAELPPSPAWAETTPHSDEPGRLASVESGGVQAGGGSEVSPPADPSDDVSVRLVSAATEWATNHMDQWDKFKVETPDGPVYVSLVRQTRYPNDFETAPVDTKATPGQPLPNLRRVHAVCMSRMVEMLLNEVDRDTLVRMRRAAYPESGE